MDLRPEQLRAFSRFGLGAGAWFEGAQRVQAVLGERAVGIDAATQDQGDPVEDRRRNRAGHSSGAAPKVTTAGNLGRAPITELRQEPLQELNPRPTLLAFSTAWNGIPLMSPGWLTGNYYPFDDDNGSFVVMVNDEEHHNLWPTFADIPAGWRVVYGEAGRAACREYIEPNWVAPRRYRYTAEESGGEAGKAPGF
jgi:uncharacterized protein YbdZ (MbtH family)